MLNLLDYIPQTEWPAIVAGTSTYDCLPALMQALSIYGMPPGITQAYSAAGPDIYIPAGKYCFSKLVNIKRRVRIFGDDSQGGYGSEGTILKFLAGGFAIQRYNTLDYGIASPGYQGDGSIIERLYIQGSGVGDGVLFRARGVLRDCRITGFGKDGVKIHATSGGGGCEEGNANEFVVERVQAFGNAGNGFSTQGADANAGSFINCSAAGNGGDGFFENSFLGNTYDTCRAEANGGIPFHCLSPNAHNTVLINPYMEGGQNLSVIMAPALVVGGNLQVSSDSTAAIITGGSTLQVSRGLTAGDSNLAVTLAGDTNNGDIVKVDDPVKFPLAWRIRRVGGDIRMDYGNLDSDVYSLFTGPNTTQTFSKQVPTPYALNTPNLFIGQGLSAQPVNSGCVTYTIPWAPLPVTNLSQNFTDFPAQGAIQRSHISLAYDQDLKGVQMWGQCVQPDHVRVWLRNETGNKVVLSSGNIIIRVVT